MPDFETRMRIIDPAKRRMNFTGDGDALDWKGSPSAHIPVALAGTEDADWVLGEDERKF